MGIEILTQNYSMEAFNGAQAGILAMAVINWLFCFFNIFAYFYWIIGEAGTMGLLNIFIGLSATTISSVATNLTKVLALYRWPMFAGVMLNVFLNACVTFWPMIWYVNVWDKWEPEMSANQTTLYNFIYTWLIIGWIPYVLMGLEWKFDWGLGW
jgi:hypothetical protein